MTRIAFSLFGTQTGVLLLSVMFQKLVTSMKQTNRLKKLLRQWQVSTSHTNNINIHSISQYNTLFVCILALTSDLSH